nr:toxin-antitoxin system HicB family antitoxin [Anaerolineae bacterium]
MNTGNEDRDLEYYLRLPYRVEVYPEPDGSGYTAAIPDLPGCITCADTMDELAEMIEDAKRTWIECSLEDGLPIPEPSSVDDELVPVPRAIHRRLVERARREKQSVAQLVEAALASAVG